MRDISEEMSMQLFAGIRKMGKLNGGDRQGMKRNHPGKTQRFSCKQENGSLPCPHPNFQRHKGRGFTERSNKEGKPDINGCRAIKERPKGIPKAQADGAKEFSSLQTGAALQGFPEH